MIRYRFAAATAVVAAMMFTTAPAAARQAEATPPPAAQADVESVDAIIAALYDVISGPAGQRRDWARFNSLFMPGARLIPTGLAANGAVQHRVMTSADFAATTGPLLEERGFFEVEIGRITERFGNIVHVFSAYDSRRTAADPEPFARGINSIQLLNDGERYWVVTVFWDSERPDNMIPQRYLGGGR